MVKPLTLVAAGLLVLPTASLSGLLTAAVAAEPSAAPAAVPAAAPAAGQHSAVRADAAAAPWREEPAVAALFREAGLQGTFVLLDETRGELRGSNRARAEQRFVPASSFKVANALIGLSLGAVQGWMR